MYNIKYYITHISLLRKISVMINGWIYIDNYNQVVLSSSIILRNHFSCIKLLNESITNFIDNAMQTIKSLRKRILIINYSCYNRQRIDIMIGGIMYQFDKIYFPGHIPMLIPRNGYNITQLMKYS